MLRMGSPKAASASLTSSRCSSPWPTNWTLSPPCLPSFFLPSDDSSQSPSFSYAVPYHALNTLLCHTLSQSESRPRYVRLSQPTGFNLFTRQFRHRSRVVDRSAIGQRLHDLRRHTHDQVRFGVRIRGIAEQSAQVRNVTEVRDFLNLGLLFVQDQARDDQRLVVTQLDHRLRAPSYEGRHRESEQLHAFGKVGLRYFRLNQEFDLIAADNR